MPVDRRLFIRNLLAGAGVFTIFPQELFASSQCDVLYPITPPDMQLKGVCLNCGMKRPMWARTWHTYSLDGEKFELCSMHCLAEASLNSGRVPEAVQAALYLEPRKSI